ncbi:MAG: hypothetical protein KGK03_06870 [Candidatus Omnitrophica bacterium]|nr:hypothetical protein [Candidatus Omnitrophota bacterium]
MSLKTVDLSPGHVLFLLVILFVICCNFYAQWPNFKSDILMIRKHQADQIGTEFAVLAPYLKNVDWAGFATCVESSHPATDVAVMGPYQQAQFVLSPTILDYIRPLDYPYVVFQCPSVALQKHIERHLSHYIVLKHTKRVSLLYRKKGAQ